MNEKKKQRRTQAQLIEKHRADATYADGQVEKWRHKAAKARERAAQIESDIRASFEALES
jgi:hypothetical protein